MSFLIFIFGFVGVWADGEDSSFSSTGTTDKICNDLEPSDDLSVKGVLNYRGESYIDKCEEQGLSVREYFCDEDKLRSFVKRCPSGIRCSDGTCGEGSEVVIDNNNDEVIDDGKKGFSLEVANIDILGYEEGKIYSDGEILDVDVYLKDSKGGRVDLSEFKHIYLRVYLNTYDENGDLSGGGSNSYEMECPSEGYCSVSWPISLADIEDYGGKLYEPNKFSFSIYFQKEDEEGEQLDIDKEFSFEVKTLNRDLCKEIIPGFNVIEEDRANVVFVGLGYSDKDFVDATCAEAEYNYCVSKGYQGYNFSEYISDEKIMKINCYNSYNKNNYGLGKDFMVSLEELQTYDTEGFSHCTGLPTSSGEVVKDIAEYYIDQNGDNRGLFSVEPFKSNKEKFNFWYIDEVASLSDCGESVHCESALSRARSLSISCVMSNKFVTYVISRQFRSNAGSVIALSSPVSVDYLPYSPYVQIHRAAAFVHEFGHQFGNLRDEYVEIRGTTWNPNSILSQPSNCYASNPSSEEDCLENAPWKAYIGDGCGEEGIVDCTEQREDYLNFNEVGCFESCLLTEFGIFRSTFGSIMRSHYSPPFLFGPWNEKLIQDQLDKFNRGKNV